MVSNVHLQHSDLLPIRLCHRMLTKLDMVRHSSYRKRSSFNNKTFICKYNTTKLYKQLPLTILMITCVWKDQCEGKPQKRWIIRKTRMPTLMARQAWKLGWSCSKPEKRGRNKRQEKWLKYPLQTNFLFGWIISTRKHTNIKRMQKGYLHNREHWNSNLLL